MRLPVNRNLLLLALAVLPACSLAGGGARHVATAPPPAANGPSADYPMVIGEPYSIGAVSYRPEDKLNYDAVGRAAMAADGGSTVSLAHKTLPVPSYVEVTSLASGRTILARVSRRGPMDNDHLIALSPGAAAQLGLADDGTPVRVRRVNPPEPERALLRAGQRAPERMATPKPLVDVLLRRLGGGLASTASPPAAPALPPASVTPQPPVKPAGRARPPRPAPAVPVQPGSAATAPAAATAAHGTLAIQAGAFSTRERADTVAAAIGGRVEPAGKFFRVRVGPFADRANAEAALAKVRAAGYKDARIQSTR